MIIRNTWNTFYVICNTQIAWTHISISHNIQSFDFISNMLISCTRMMLIVFQISWVGKHSSIQNFLFHLLKCTRIFVKLKIFRWTFGLQHNLKLTDNSKIDWKKKNEVSEVGAVLIAVISMNEVLKMKVIITQKSHLSFSIILLLLMKM